MRWRTFADSIVDAAGRLNVEIVITLGALIADVAHTRPVPITGLASDPAWSSARPEPLQLRGADRHRGGPP